MSLPAPTITWSKTSERNMAVAGTNATIAEILVALNAMFTSDSTYWQVSDYNSGNGTLEVKRRATGSPAGEYATIRFLFMGGQTPNTAAISTPQPSLASTSLYFAGSVDANTTGPAASYASAAPYTTKYMKGSLVAINTSFALSRSPKVAMVESTEGFVVSIHDTTNAALITAGYLLEDTLGQQIQWCHITSGGTYANQTLDNGGGLGTSGATTPIPIWTMTGDVGHGNYWSTTTTTCRAFGRVNAMVTGLSQFVAGSSGNALTLVPIMVCEGAVASSATGAFFGYLRQLRLGPQASSLQTMTNLSAVQQAIAIGSPVSATGWTNVWCDQVP